MSTNRREIAGLSLAVLCAVILGIAVAVSRYAYDDGASAVVVALARSFLLVTTLVVWLVASGRSPWLPRELVMLSVLNGILMGAMSYGNIGSVEFISVGLAALLFYTFPILIAVLLIALRMEHVTTFKLGALALAFFGLALMLFDAVGAVDIRGVLLALGGSLATAVNAILVGRYFRTADILVVTLHFSVIAMLFLLALAFWVVPVRVPETAAGWGGVAGVAVFQAVGTPLYFLVIARIGALKTGLVMNVQPVTSITAAWWLFGELLSVLQAIGGGIVLVAIALVQWIDLRGRRR